jgi:anti-sigma B factor antagonist
MPQANATMNIIKPNDHTNIIEINGEITAYAENALMEAYNSINLPEIRNIILDFTNMEYMNSSGIGLLITLLVRANRQGQKLFATGLNAHYRRIFELTRLNEAIHIYPSVDEAMVAAV